MPLFSIQVSTVSRRAGASAVRHAAYRAGEQIWDERARRTRDYARKADVVHAEILAPDGTPDWMQDRARLWNGVEAVERRKDARLAQEVYVAIPRAVAPEKRLDAIREFVKETFVAKGMIADFAIHAPAATDGREDPHAHIMLTTRPVEAGQFGRKSRHWNHPGRIAEYRLAWEKHANLALARSGSIQRVDRRSLRDQKREIEHRLRRAIARRDRFAARQHARSVAILDRVPEIALGRAASHMEKQGRKTERGKRLREIRTENALSRDARVRQGMRKAMQEIDALERAERIARLQNGIRERLIHALPRAVQRRVYLRRNQRLLAAAAHEAPSLEKAPNSRQFDLRTSRDRGREHGLETDSDAPRPAPGEQRPQERGQRSRYPNLPNDRSSTELHSVHGPMPTGTPDIPFRHRRESGADIAGSLQGNRTLNAPPSRDGRNQSRRNEIVSPAMEPTATGETCRPNPLAGKTAPAPQDEENAQERLRQWLDGERTPRSSRPKRREREFGLER